MKNTFFYVPSSLDKAKEINLSNKFYGSFAEIGGGQECGRYFFRAGAASQTIARTISAYAKDFSDVTYTPEINGRYVAESRLIKMLRTESKLVEKYVVNADNRKKNFFSYANTVTTIDFAKRYKGHGWIGIRYEIGKEQGYNEILIHIRFKQDQVHLQHEVLGILGVNLIHAAFYNYETPEEIIDRLYDGIDKDHLEIDTINFSGPLFKNVDNRMMSMLLVKKGITKAVVFSPQGKSLLPVDLFYKKNILILRGSFRPVTLVNEDLFKKSYEKMLEAEGITRENTEVVFEITFSNLTQQGKCSIEEGDFMDRAELLSSLGCNVLLTKFNAHFEAVQYLTKFTNKTIRFTLGIDNLVEVFNENYYKKINGGCLEGLGNFFQDNVHIYVYPVKKNKELFITSKNLQLENPKMQILYEFLREDNVFTDLIPTSYEYLDIYSKNILNMIETGKTGWEKHLPQTVTAIIKRKKLFGYKK